MKRLFAFLLSVSLIFCLAACAPGGYLNSTEGDLTITLPEEEEAKPIELNEPGEALIGKWELISLTTNGVEAEYGSGNYTFSEYGYLDIVIDSQNDRLSFSCRDDDVLIDGNLVEIITEGELVSIKTSNNLVHVLKKIQSEEPVTSEE